MSVQPTVACILLTKDRPQMARRAVECFRRSTYEQKRLVIYDTSEQTYSYDVGDVVYEWPRERTIGALRNAANGHSEEDIIIHTDDDDWYHPARISEQVALLQSSGAQAVGYNEALFWRTYPSMVPELPGEAWLYTSINRGAVLGASLCYWREIWRSKPFPDLPKHPLGMTEDWRWQVGLKVAAVSALPTHTTQLPRTHESVIDGRRVTICDDELTLITEPRLICGVHGGNSRPYTEIGRAPEYVRVPEWDAVAREAMKL